MHIAPDIDQHRFIKVFGTKACRDVLVLDHAMTEENMVDSAHQVVLHSIVKLLLYKLRQLEVTLDEVDLSRAFITVNGLNGLAIDAVFVSYKHYEVCHACLVQFSYDFGSYIASGPSYDYMFACVGVHVAL